MRRPCVVSVLILLVTVLPAGAAAGSWGGPVQRLYRLNPDTRVNQRDGRVTSIVGAPFGFGATVIESADSFRQTFATLWGVAVDDLRPGNWLNDKVTQPLMYDRAAGTYKFTLVYYSQFFAGLPVFRSDLRLLARNEDSYPLVLAVSSLRDLGDFEVRQAEVDSARADLGYEAAIGRVADLVNFDPAELVVFAGGADAFEAPRLAFQFIADNGLPATGEYEKWLFVTDAATGEILLAEDQIVHTDVQGTVTGVATGGIGADICEEEVARPMKYARVTVGETAVYADQSGAFTIPNDGDDVVTVTSEVRGEWFRVVNQGGDNSVLTMEVSPPGPAEFVHNEANDQEYARAEVNAYVEANVIRDFVLAYNPEYPTIHDQKEFPANVNINDSCNAFYVRDESINFFRAQGGCSNTANSTVVHHEYGHHLVQTGGSGQGQYGEGMSDTVAVLITDQPLLAVGFYNRCDRALRDARKVVNYPCDGEIHDCGVLLSGAVWATRNELVNTNPDTYRDIISNLTINSIPLHEGNLITPEITETFLVLDDDDDNIYNGTPHYNEISAGFGSRKLYAPKLQSVGFEFPGGFPDVIHPSGGTRLRLLVSKKGYDPQPGTGKLHFSTGDEFTEIPMEELEDNVYDAVFPAIECGTNVRYYVSAEGVNGQRTTYPVDAPDVTLSAFSLSQAHEFFADDFEADTGWSVENSDKLSTGAWDRGVPAGGQDRGQPYEDSDDSGQCYLTDNRSGNYDVDNGYTRLISPRLDVSGDAIITYARWYFSSDTSESGERFTVSISNDDGQTWTTVEEIRSNTAESRGGWFTHAFQVASVIEPTDEVRIRFEAADQPMESRIEAGVDAFHVLTYDCGGPLPLGDMNCSGAVDFDDIDPFVLALVSPDDYATQYPDCDVLLGDIDGSRAVDFGDIDGFVAVLTE
jgi:hypothetical protein